MFSAHRDLPANAPGDPEPWPLREPARLRVVSSAQALPAELARLDAAKLGTAKLGTAKLGTTRFVAANGQLPGQQSPHAALDTPEPVAEATTALNGSNGHPPVNAGRTALNGTVPHGPVEAVDGDATEVDAAELEAAEIEAAEREAAEFEAAELAAESVAESPVAESPVAESAASANADSGQRPVDISELVAAAVRGDQASVEQLLAYIQPRVFRYCRGRVGRNDRSYTSADDVAQEVMVAVLRALPKYTERGRPFLAFVYGIAHNKVADARRVSHRNRSDPYDEVPDSADVGGGPEAAALAGELRGRLKKHLDRLQQNQRDILLYRVVVGLSAEETADVVGSTAGAVRVAQHRALTKLRSMLGGEQM